MTSTYSLFFFYFLQRQPSPHRDTPNYHPNQHTVLFQTTYPNLRSFTYQKPAFLPTFSPFPATILVNPYPPSHFHPRALNRRISKIDRRQPSFTPYIYTYTTGTLPHYKATTGNLPYYIHEYTHKHIVYQIPYHTIPRTFTMNITT
jgi:hypothetical protein